MIKKTTKVLFEGEPSSNNNEQIGGMPLSKGETVRIHRNSQTLTYIVTGKEIDYFDGTTDKLVTITYTLKRQA